MENEFTDNINKWLADITKNKKKTNFKHWNQINVCAAACGLNLFNLINK